MRQGLRSHLTYANVMATIAVFLVLGGGSAVALTGSNTVFSDDITDNQVFSADVRNDTLTGGGLAAADLRPGSVGTSEVALNGLGAADLAPGSVGTSEATDNSLTGTDIDESSLGEVPSATLGGLGGSPLGSPCDPESTSFTTCASGGIDLPAPSRVLIIGQIRAEPDTGGGNGGGSCAVASDLAGAHAQVPVFVNGGQTDVIAISAVTPAVGPGPVSLRIECNETASGIRYFNPRVSFVALSPG